MRAERLEIIHKRLLWLLIIAFSVAWGATAALADDVKSVWISGATSVNDGASVQLKAYAQIGSETKDITTESNNKWSLSSSTYASIARGKLTTKEVPGCQTQKVTVTISYSRDGVTKNDSHDISILDNECGASTPPPPTLQGISLGGPTSMDENTSADFPVTATMSDGTSKSVTAVMTENSVYASLSGIRLTVTEVTSNQVVSVGASYTEGGVTRTASTPVQIIDKTTAPPPVTLQSISIGGPSSLNENVLR